MSLGLTHRARVVPATQHGGSVNERVLGRLEQLQASAGHRQAAAAAAEIAAAKGKGGGGGGGVGSEPFKLDKKARQALAERYQMQSSGGSGGSGGQKKGGGEKMVGARKMTNAERAREKAAAEKAKCRYIDGELVTRKGEKSVTVGGGEDPAFVRKTTVQLGSLSRKGRSGR
eukprot:SAG22_NODE_5619_length_983_cov_1.546380_2_plen_172_part_00